MNPIDIVCLGEPMIELNEGGSTDGSSGFLSGFGGDTSNAAVAAARQQASVAYVTRIGTDVFGDSLAKLWEREKIDISGIARDDRAPTGLYFVTHGPGGHSFSYRRAGSAASRMTPDDLPLDLLRRARFLHVSGISQAISDVACDAVFAAIASVRAAGGKICYDTNLRLKLWPLPRARAITHATVSMSDVVLPSLEDGTVLTGLTNADEIASFYLGLGTPLVVVKCGSEGVLVATSEKREMIRGHRVATIDATGAGDTFDGAFLAEIVRHGSPFVAARYANAAAALSTMGYGAIDPIPHRSKVEAFLMG